MEIGEKIKKIRKEKKMTLEQLGYKIGLKKSTVSVYEKGGINIPIDNLRKIADALDVNINYFLNNDKQFEDENFVDTSILNDKQLKELDTILATNNVMFFKGNNQNEDAVKSMQASITRAFIKMLKQTGDL